jgi:hypothetical protein
MSLFLFLFVRSFLIRFFPLPIDANAASFASLAHSIASKKLINKLVISNYNYFAK